MLQLKVTLEQLQNAIDSAILNDDYHLISNDTVDIEVSVWSNEVDIDFAWFALNEDAEFRYESGMSFKLDVDSPSFHDELYNVLQIANNRYGTEQSFDIYEYHVPTHFKGAMFYDDLSPLDDNEVISWQQFLDNLPEGGHFAIKEELGFKQGHYSDIKSCLACDMFLAEYLVRRSQ